MNVSNWSESPASWWKAAGILDKNLPQTSSAQYFLGTPGNDSFVGMLGVNTTYEGGAGDDTINGGGSGNNPLANDSLVGGAGADTFVVTDSDYLGWGFSIVADFNYREGDKINLNVSDPALLTYETGYYQAGIANNNLTADTLIKYDGDLIAIVEDVTFPDFAPVIDVVISGSSSVLSRGTGADDRAIGSFGVNDRLLGFAGNDTLDGNGGYDRLYGGAGADTFVVTDSDYIGTGYARVRDFNPFSGDVINLVVSDRNLVSYGSGNSDVADTSANDVLIYYDNDLIAVLENSQFFFNSATDVVFG